MFVINKIKLDGIPEMLFLATPDYESIWSRTIINHSDAVIIASSLFNKIYRVFRKTFLPSSQKIAAYSALQWDAIKLTFIFSMYNNFLRQFF
jgi:hypothetical protein